MIAQVVVNPITRLTRPRRPLSRHISKGEEVGF